MKTSLADYIRWYADFSFYEKEFTEVDNLVLSSLAYYRYDLKKHDNQPVSLRRAVKNSFDNDDFLEAAYHSRRFGSLLVHDCTEVFDGKTSTQFAAMTIHLYDNVYYIAFRGTDNSLVGWREDFMISYRMTDGQNRAVKYLEDHITENNMYFVGGHSKGGNLALYGCSHLDDVRLGRILHIYNNDGPGLCPEVSDVSRVAKIGDRVTQIMPTYCVFGKIFEHDFKDKRIVTSSNNGMMQHDIFSWEVENGKLSIAKSFDPECEWIDAVADKWLEDVTPEEREKLVRIVFDTFDKDGKATFDSALAKGLDGVDDLLKNMVKSDTIKTAAKLPEKAVFGGFFENFRKGNLKKFISANELKEGVVYILFGVLMLAIPHRAVQLLIIALFGGFAVFQLIYTIRSLIKSKWNFEKERARVYILVLAVTLFVLILVKQNAAFIVGCGAAGGWLLVVAYKSFLAVRKAQKRDFLYYKNIVKAVLYTACGIAILVIPSDALRWVVLSIGVVMTVDGICTIVYSIIRANDRYSIKYNHFKEKMGKKDKTA